MSRYVLHTAQQGDRLSQIVGRVGTDFPRDTTNYWTITFARLRTGQTYGEKIGSFPLNTFDLSATKDNNLYSPGASLPLEEGDKVVVDLDQTGTPDPLTELVMSLKITTLEG